MNAGKALKAALVRQFPGVAFAVRYDRHTDAVTVTWTDGPSIPSVERITKGFEGGEFDAYSDCYRWTAPEGATAARYVSVVRHYSPRAWQSVKNRIAARYPQAAGLSDEDMTPDGVPDTSRHWYYGQYVNHRAQWLSFNRDWTIAGEDAESPYAHESGQALGLDMDALAGALARAFAGLPVAGTPPERVTFRVGK